MFNFNFLFSYILPFMIFLSLAIIIYIIGRNFSDFKKNQKESDFDQKNGIVKKKLIQIIAVFFCKIRDLLLSVSEKIVRKSKELLHLVHFWLIKIRKGKNKKDDFINEIEAKEELIKEEEENLDRVLNEDLANSEEQDLMKKNQVSPEEYNFDNVKKGVKKVAKTGSIKQYYLKHRNEEGKIDSGKETDDVSELKEQIDQEFASLDKERNSFHKKESENKLNKFFLNDESKPENDFDGESETNIKHELQKRVDVDEELSIGENRAEADKDSDIEREAGKKRDGFFSKINVFKNFKNKKKESSDDYEDDFVQNEEDAYSDGIVKVSNDSRAGNDNLLIKEVVRVNRRDNDIDDEIGVDRKILEKKLIQKIVKSPKQIENYRQLGELYLKVENFIEAIDCYKQILKIYPRDVDAKRKIEKIGFLKRVKK